MRIFNVTSFDAEMIARSYETVQRSCELLRRTQHLTRYLLERQHDPLFSIDAPEDEPQH
ncbi:hypothetical protein SAMN05216337_108513 [Bradyrhizobium brasilense]|uniref:Uncharacterized protein n=1 Tax=Bradyrhizobium brasilense TaxID=1419277 RepID=A0A1G7PVH2_9BRAD|nr:hypothetical protein SAMN05216337_108513 [Bradyrhizobium brasilense]